MESDTAIFGSEPYRNVGSIKGVQPKRVEWSPFVCKTLANCCSFSITLEWRAIDIGEWGTVPPVSVTCQRVVDARRQQSAHLK